MPFEARSRFPKDTHIALMLLSCRRLRCDSCGELKIPKSQDQQLFVCLLFLFFPYITAQIGWKVALSEASHSEDVQIVRRRFGQKLDASDAMAFLAESKEAVILLMETLFRVTARTNFPLALDTYSQ